MKKYLLIFIVSLLFFSTGCEKDNESTINYSQMILGSWNLNSYSEQHREGYIINGVKTYTYIDSEIYTEYPEDVVYTFSEDQIHDINNEYYLNYSINDNLIVIYEGNEINNNSFHSNWEITDINSQSLEVIYDDFYPGDNPNDTVWFDCYQGEISMNKIL